MDFQTIAAIIFLIAMALFLVINRKNIEIQKIFFPILYFTMYKTKLGLKAMDKCAKKYKKILHFLSYISIGLGFIGMILIVGSLVHNLWKILFTTTAVQGVALVLPFKVKGGFYVPFFYWIISIFIIALVHEFAHGIYARLHDIKVKSSGFAFLNIIIPILPAAFVEPDEKQLAKASRKKQLDVFSAGPFSNILTGFLFLGILMLFSGLVSDTIVEPIGVEVTGFIDDGTDYPAERSGINKGEVIDFVNTEEIATVDDFIKSLESAEPGDVITLGTGSESYDIELVPNPENESKGMLGIMVQQKTDISSSFGGGKLIGLSIIWLMGLLYWLFVLSIGIGLFNLAPLGPIDGGKMLLTVLTKYMPEKRAVSIWKYTSFSVLLLVLVNILVSFF